MARILVLDDDPTIRQLLQTVLSLRGYEVVTASDGRRGLQSFHQMRPDLVITDMLMPEQEGIETILELRRIDAEVPILAISGDTARLRGQTHLDAAECLGADRTLRKPFGTSELEEVVAELLSKKRAHSPPISPR